MIENNTKKKYQYYYSEYVSYISVYILISVQKKLYLIK